VSVSFDKIEDVIAAIGRGELVVMTDDENRENEGDLVCAAAKASPEAINFMVTYGRGLVCVPITAERAEALGLLRATPPSDSFKTAFTESVDAKNGISTGISAFDRAATVATLIDPASTSAEIVSPGHLFPLVARPGGVLQRAGHTEAAVDLARLAGLSSAGVICEIMNDDGSMARLPEAQTPHGLHCRSHRLQAYT